jgi:uncharacterized protein YggE
MRCVLVLSLAFLALPALAQQSPPAPPPTLRVTGTARISSRPDRVQIDIGVSTRAVRSEEAAAQNARQVEAVLAAVRRAAGPGAELKTVSYTLNPVYQYHPKGEEPTLIGYVASNLVQVTLDDLARMGAVIDAATQSGANQVQGIQFTLRDTESVRAAALRQAATQARAEADVLAAALGLKIVRVLTVEEISPRVVPLRMSMGATRAAAAADAATPVEAGMLDVSADVGLTVEVREKP